MALVHTPQPSERALSLRKMASVIIPCDSQEYKSTDKLIDLTYDLRRVDRMKYYSAIAGPFSENNLPPFFVHLGDKEMGDMAQLVQAGILTIDDLHRWWPTNFGSDGLVLASAKPYGRPHVTYSGGTPYVSRIGTRLLVGKDIMLAQLDQDINFRCVVGPNKYDASFGLHFDIDEL
ncbi:hypothetical protein BDZ85DRAFT_283907 [Elsinoe ampelina]|uniref:Uncharacterized protein n=1 Tax=Elsinoe ampelina TaxID=302913 RepID=A0A6A6G5N0_9PEZI|nr:hypothetical protein BDZ85DRAFT_283907 [Elsinoe ampelina]